MMPAPGRAADHREPPHRTARRTTFGRRRAASPLEICSMVVNNTDSVACWTAPTSVFRSLCDTACQRDKLVPGIGHSGTVLRSGQ